MIVFPSVSVCPSFHQHLVSPLLLEYFLMDFIQILHTHIGICGLELLMGENYKLLTELLSLLTNKNVLFFSQDHENESLGLVITSYI